MKPQFSNLAERVGYQFNDKFLLELALTHRSASANNNERLEFLGDAILGMVISDWLYARFESASEGQLSRLRASLVKRETLAAIATKLDLGAYLQMGTGEQRSGGQSRTSTLADAVEAVIASIYLDGGIDHARELIHRLYAARLESVDLNDCKKDPKTRLQEYLQGRGLDLPDYEILRTEGKQHNQRFTVRCNVADMNLFAEGEGRSRRKAEQAAAGILLEQIDAI